MPDGNPLVWAWLLLACGTVALGTSNPVLLLTLVCGLLATGLAAGGPRRPALRAGIGLALAAMLAWACLTLLLPGDQTGTLLWQRPVFTPGQGVELGGALTVDGVTGGLVDALRAAALALLVGLAGQLVSGRGWTALAHTTLGSLGPLVTPLCRLGEGTALATLDGARGRRWRLTPRPGNPGDVFRHALALSATDHRISHGPMTGLRTGLVLATVAGLILVQSSGAVPALARLTGVEQGVAVVGALIVVGAALPGRDPAVWAWGRHDVPPFVAAAALSACWILRDSFVAPAALLPPAGTWSEIPVLLLLAVAAVPASVMAAVSTAVPGRRPGEAVAHG